MKLSCRLGVHNWGKWEEVELHYSVQRMIMNVNIGEPQHRTKNAMRRYCLDCGEQQIKELSVPKSFTEGV